MVHYSNTDKTGRSRLFLDNAATSFPKPPQVLEAMTDYALRLGASAGRGAYREAVETGAIVTGCRHRLNQLFNGENANHFIFTLNCSDALNLAIKGLVDPLCHDADRLPHAICTHIDHNSILRPLNALVSAGLLTQSRVAVDPGTGMADPDNVRKAIRPQTRLIATTHASNVTGTVQPIREIGRIAREHAIPFIVDAAQSAGHVPIDVREDCIDLLAAPGHKGLFGPLGTGFLYIRPGLEKALRTIREGGTGSVSELDHQPDFMPDKYEPGSHNAIGIAGLSAGIKWVLSEGVAKLAAHESELCATFIDRIGNVADLRYFGPRGVMDRMGVFSVRIADLAPEELSAILETYYGILTRSGLHCAPLAQRQALIEEGWAEVIVGPQADVQDRLYAMTDAPQEYDEQTTAKLKKLADKRVKLETKLEELDESDQGAVEAIQTKLEALDDEEQTLSKDAEVHYSEATKAVGTTFLLLDPDGRVRREYRIPRTRQGASGNGHGGGNGQAGHGSTEAPKPPTSDDLKDGQLATTFTHQALAVREAVLKDAAARRRILAIVLHEKVRSEALAIRHDANCSTVRDGLEEQSSEPG